MMKTIDQWNIDIEACTTLAELATVKRDHDAWKVQVDAIDQQIIDLEMQKENLLKDGNVISEDELKRNFQRKLVQLWKVEYAV